MPYKLIQFVIEIWKWQLAYYLTKLIKNNNRFKDKHNHNNNNRISSNNLNNSKIKIRIKRIKKMMIKIKKMIIIKKMEMTKKMMTIAYFHDNYYNINIYFIIINNFIT